MDYAPMRDTAMRAAREAGELARAALGDPGYQQWKGQRDILVGSTLPIQERIIEIIRADFPDHAVLAEETDEGQAAPATDASLPPGPLWIIDPIDGSLNFHQGIPHFAISIAYRDDEINRVGVVYNPCNGEMFHAVHNQYARLHDQPIIVQQVSEGEDAYDRAIIGTDWSGSLRERQEGLNIATLLAGQCISLVAMGSPALGLCYVAAGRLHAYYHLTLQPWDVAAASVILRESGGILTDIRGGSWLHSNGGYIATNGIIHGWMLRGAMAVLNRHRMG